MNIKHVRLCLQICVLVVGDLKLHYNNSFPHSCIKARAVYRVAVPCHEPPKPNRF